MSTEKMREEFEFEQKEVISRSQARLLGNKFYFNGRPCSRGHMADRYVSSCVCVMCGSIDSKNYYTTNGDSELSRGYYHKRRSSGWKHPDTSDFRDKANQRTKPTAAKNYHRWNQEDDRMLLSLERQGLNFEQIALAMGRTRHSIQNRKLYIAKKKSIAGPDSQSLNQELGHD